LRPISPTMIRKIAKMKLSGRGTIRIKMPARRATSGVMWAMW
jgi:hypothetical protein